MDRKERVFGADVIFRFRVWSSIWSHSDYSMRAGRAVTSKKPVEIGPHSDQRVFNAEKAY